MATTTSTTTTTAVNLSLFELLLRTSTSGKLPIVLLVGQPSEDGRLGTSEQAHALLLNSARHANARTKRTAGRVCVQCGTSATVQWRKGPDGTTS